MTLPLPRSFRLRFVQLGFPFGCEVGGRLFAYVATTLPTVHKDGYRIFVVESTPTEFDGKKLRLPFSRFQALLILLLLSPSAVRSLGAIKREEPALWGFAGSSSQKGGDSLCMSFMYQPHRYVGKVNTNFIRHQIVTVKI